MHELNKVNRAADFLKKAKCQNPDLSE